jgi:ISXO2-like transposase domain
MGSSPSPPDPMQTSMIQGIFNSEAAQEQQALNMTNQVTPYGTLTYTRTPGESGPRGLFGQMDAPGAYTATTVLSPEMQKLFGQNVSNAQLSADIGGQLEKNVMSSASQPLDLGWSATEANLDALNRQRLDPLWQQNTEAEKQSLYNQGLSPDTPGYATHVSHKVSLLCTDQWTGYKCLDGEYPHATVDHARGEYVIGAIHTQTIEGFWSIFKRGIVGTFHKMSRKYMPLYIAEFQFRYNNRENVDIFGTAIKGC